jgi:N-acetylglucosamine repressor
VANASQTAALAEYLFTDAPRDGNLAVVRVGQDVGVGLILDGQPYFGDGYGAGELGHLVVVEDGELCQCGNRGCLETIVSRNSVLRQAQYLSEQHPKSILAREIEAAGTLNLDVVLSAYRQNDPYAHEIADRVADYVGRASASIVTLANVQRIHYVGSVTQFGEAWLDKVRASMLKHAIPDLAGQTTTAIAQLGADAVILGAAALLMSRDLGLTLEIRR